MHCFVGLWRDVVCFVVWRCCLLVFLLASAVGRCCVEYVCVLFVMWCVLCCGPGVFALLRRGVIYLSIYIYIAMFCCVSVSWWYVVAHCVDCVLCCTVVWCAVLLCSLCGVL